jgi:hypothetical protein
MALYTERCSIGTYAFATFAQGEYVVRLQILSAAALLATAITRNDLSRER